jgi:hypothetical protein
MTAVAGLGEVVRASIPDDGVEDSGKLYENLLVPLVLLSITL